MPILHLQYTVERTDPQGHIVQTDGKAALQKRGPVVQVTVSLGTAIAQTLQQSGQAVPTPVSGWALIDTGADCTCIDGESAVQMGLPVIDVAKMASASHEGTQQNVHPIKIEFAGVSLVVEAERAMTAKLAPFGLLLIIGRDTLKHCVLVYNGLAGTITLSA